jgi:phage shock protein A
MGTAWNKLKTVMRGQARVSMERLVDANDMLLLDQQLYETEHALRDARRQLAEQKRNRERSEQLTRQQEHYEAGARQAMAHEEEGLALDIGQRLAELEAQQARLEQQGVSLGQQENEFQRFIQQAAEQLRSLRHEQSMARTQEALFGQAEVRQQQGRGLAQRLTDSQQTLLQIQQRQEECRWLWQSEIGDSRSERAKEILQRLSRE